MFVFFSSVWMETTHFTTVTATLMAGVTSRTGYAHLLGTPTGCIPPNTIPRTTVVVFGAITDTGNISIYIHIMDINIQCYRHMTYPFKCCINRNTDLFVELTCSWAINGLRLT